MPWAVHKEHPETFEVSGNAGSRFHVSKANLRPHVVQKFRELCKGGAAKKMADGGQAVEDAERPRGEPEEGAGEIAEGAPPDVTVVIDGTAPEEKKPNDGKAESMRTVREEPPHFVIGGPNGEFRVHADNLSAGGIARLRKLAQGGEAQPGYQDPRATGNEKVAVQTSGDQVNVRPGMVQENPAATRRTLMNVKRPQQPQNFAGGGVSNAWEDQAPPAPATPVQTSSLASDDEGDPTAARDRIAAAESAADVEPPSSGGMARADDDDAPVRKPVAAPQRQAETAAPPYQPRPVDMYSPQDIMASSRAVEQAIVDQASTQKTAADGLAQAQMKRAEAERNAAEALQTHYSLNREMLEKQLQDLQDPKNNIDPNHFWSSKSTFERVVTGIGLALGGIGAGLTGTPNGALEYVNNAIGRDIDAQKANLNKRWTLYGYHRQMLGDDLAADQATRALMLNSLSAEIESAGTRAQGLEKQSAYKVLATQTRQAALMSANQATMQKLQGSKEQLQLEQAIRNEQLLRAIYGGSGKGSAPSQNLIAEAGARGLVKPVVIDRNGALGIARSEGDAAKVNEELGSWHAAQDVLEQMETMRSRFGSQVAIPATDVGKKYAGLQNQLGMAIDHATAGRVNNETLAQQVQNMGGSLAQLWFKDPLAATREWINAQHRSIVNQRTWSREAPSVSGTVGPPVQAHQKPPGIPPGYVRYQGPHGEGGWGDPTMIRNAGLQIVGP